jgi:aspartyl-tRNA(Asn)/glutamyl-tRNA(Gln) amidotransferase subunit C
MDIKVDEKLIKSVARNSCLSLTETELTAFENDFKDVLGNFSKLEEINVENVEPSFHPIKVEDKLREDKIEESLTEKEVFTNVEHHHDKLIRGPKIL